MSIDWDAAAAWLQHKQAETVKRLGGMLAEVNEHFEKRRTNAQRATLALYLMGRLRQQSVAIPAPPIGYQAAALRRAVLDDAAALGNYAVLEEHLRLSEAMIINEDFRTSSALQQRAAQFAPADGVTMANIECVERWNTWLLSSVVPPELPAILSDYRSLAQAERQRFSLRQLPPPLPDVTPSYWPLVGDDVPLPVEPLPTPRAHIANEVARVPKLEAITLRVASGGAIHCAAEGIVRFAGQMRGLDHVVIVEHVGGRLSVYTLLGNTVVSEGQHVRAGDVIGMAAGVLGAGEAEVSFEVREGAKPVSPRVLLGDRNPADVLLRPK
ncbi:MAG: murein hydrolase activator EnvC family protein [Candidatus Sumerlaeaceae bacterium]